METKAMFSSKQHLYFQGPYFHQNWSFSDSLIYSIIMKPLSAKSYQKLIQTCKLFFAKNPIIVAKELNRSYSDNNWTAITKTNKTQINFKNVSKKFWIFDELICRIDKTFRPQVSSIIPYLYNLDIKKLMLVNETISFEEFMFFSSNVENLQLAHTTIKNNKGLTIPIEELFHATPKIKEFRFKTDPNSLTVTSKTMKELLKLSNFSFIQQFHLYNLQESFDIESFYAHMKKNRHTKFCLFFVDTISEAYKSRLESIIDEILETKNHVYKPPFIYFPGLSDYKWEKISLLYHKY